MIVIQTLFSMFFVELTMIVGDVVGAAGLNYSQLYYTMCDSFAICTFLIVLEFIEVSRLDKIMKTRNGIRRQARKSAAAHESSEDESSDYSKGASPKKKKKKAVPVFEDDYPDWKLMLKNIQGNEHLFDTTPL